MTTTSNFTDRATYLAWRAEWKANYKQLSADIRKLKQERSATNRAYAKATTSDNWVKFRNACRDLAFLSTRANEALESLKAAKQEAAASYIANKEANMA